MDNDNFINDGIMRMRNMILAQIESILDQEYSIDYGESESSVRIEEIKREKLERRLTTLEELIRQDEAISILGLSQGLAEKIQEQQQEIERLEDKADYYINEVTNVREVANELSVFSLIQVVRHRFGDGCAMICRERHRVKEEEGFGPKHDDRHSNDELAMAALSYTTPPIHRPDAENHVPNIWPFEKEWYKPTPNNRVRELEKAGQFIAAEIDRLERKTTQCNKPEDAQPEEGTAVNMTNPDHNNRLSFEVVMAHGKQQREGNVQQAFQEMFAKRDEWNKGLIDEEPGTEDNPFRANNGIVIYYKNKV